MAETKLAPLSTQVPIVNPDTGNPLPYFQQLMQIFIDEKNAVADQTLENVEDLQDLVDVVAALELDDLADVDTTGEEQGSILHRDGTEWVVLPPGTNGDVLTTHGTGADPTWETPTSGGAGTSSLYEHITDNNVAGGPSVSGAWYGRYLNTEKYDDIGLAFRASTVTITIATPGVVSWTAHGLTAGSPVVFTTTGALPTGLTAGTIYYVIAAGLGANSFQVSATQGGTAVNTSGTQSGTHTCTSSTFELAAGDYELDAEGSFYQSNMARIRLRDLTNNVTLVASIGFYGSSANAGNAHPRAFGRFTLSGTTIVQLEYRVISSTATQGQGLPANMGEDEVHARMKITQL